MAAQPVARNLPLVIPLKFAFKQAMPDWLAVIILGIIEGVTEFLPISSTGHLLIAEHWLPGQSEMFNVVIQCGAVLAVVAVFSTRCQQLLLSWHDPATGDYLAKLVVAFGLTGAGGLVLKKLGFVLPKSIAPIAWASLIGGMFILAIETWARLRPVTQTITWPDWPIDISVPSGKY